jgi:hypothetical protein
MAAASKMITDESKLTLAKTIKDKHTQINQLKDELDADKASLTEYSKGIFIEDLSKTIPEVIGNHEYHTSEGAVTVNFKVVGRAPKEINSRPAATVIREKFGAETDKLFIIDDDVKVIAPETALRAQACEHPELFAIALKPLTHEQTMRLVMEHPDFLTVSVIDLKQYAVIYPGSVEKTPMATFKAGFIESLGKLSDIAKKNVRGLMKAILPNVIQVAVNCGNRNKKG